MAKPTPDIRNVAASIAKVRAATVASMPGRTRGNPAVAKPVTTAPPYPGYMSPADQLALAQQQAQAFYQPQLDIYKQQQAYLAQQHAAQQMGLQALYKALADSFGAVPGQIQGIYQNAAQDQSLFGKGYSQGLQLAQNQAAGQANQQLQNIGAPEGQMVNPGTGAADATYALGGTIPADTLEQQGAGFASAAAYLPSQAQLQGQMEFLKAVQQANAEDSQLLDQINSLAGQIPSKAQDILGQIQSQQDKYAQAAQPTYKTVGGNLYAIDPITGKPTLVIKGQGSTTRLTFQTVNGRRVAVDPMTGEVVKDYGPAGAPAHLTFQTVKGRKVGIDPTTGNIVVDYGPASTAASKPSNLQIKNIPVNGVMHTVAINPKNGKMAVDYGPAKSVTAKATPTSAMGKWLALTEGERNTIQQQAMKLIGQSGWRLANRPDQILTSQQVKQVINAYVQKQIQAGAKWNNGTAKNPKMISWKKQVPPGIANLKTASPAQLAELGLTGGVPVNPQSLYKQIIQTYHVPARVAWQWVQTAYPNWGKGYFKSGGAEGMGPSQSGMKLVAYAQQQIGQPYVWGGESRKEGGFDCSGLVDYAMRQEGYTGPRVTTWTLAKMGKSVKGQQLQAGDLIITNGGKHVVMYVGNGQVIGAEGIGPADTRGNTRPGDQVKLVPLSHFHIDDVRRLGSLSTRTGKAPKQTSSPTDNGGGVTYTKAEMQATPAPPSAKWVQVGPNRYQLRPK